MKKKFRIYVNPINEVQKVKTKILGDWREQKYYIYILRGDPRSLFFYDNKLFIVTIMKN